MEIELEQNANAAMEGEMDIDFPEEGIDDTEAMEAALAGYPPPPPPPPPGQRHRVMTPTESEDGAEEQTRPAMDAPHTCSPNST
jgi:E3 ubiquitin-protein ligase UBR1